MSTRPFRILASLVAATSLAAAASVVVIAPPARAAVDGVSCAVVSAYTAPDPVVPLNGSITLGFSQTSTIVADADLSPAVSASLPNLVGTSPTCLAVQADGAGVITGLDFASIGTVCGTVETDEVNGVYVVADAFIVPMSLVDAEVGFTALFGVAADAGSEICVTFLVDVASGLISGFSGTTALCGAPTVAADGSVHLAGATIPAAVPTDNGRTAADLASTSGDQVCAEVTTTGTINVQTGQFALLPTAAFALDHCGIAEGGAIDAIVVDGMELQPAGGSVERSVRTGMHIEVAGDGLVTVEAASVPGCFAAAATPEPTPAPTEEPGPSASDDLDTLPDTSVEPSAADLWWLVMLSAVSVAVLGLRAHHRRAPERAPVARWIVS